jgi:hypothetical protein
VAQQSASGGGTTQSVYVGSLEEIRTVTGAPSPGNVTLLLGVGQAHHIDELGQPLLPYGGTPMGEHLHASGLFASAETASAG